MKRENSEKEFEELDKLHQICDTPNFKPSSSNLNEETKFNFKKDENLNKDFKWQSFKEKSKLSLSSNSSPSKFQTGRKLSSCMLSSLRKRNITKTNFVVKMNLQSKSWY